MFKQIKTRLSSIVLISAMLLTILSGCGDAGNETSAAAKPETESKSQTGEGSQTGVPGETETPILTSAVSKEAKFGSAVTTLTAEDFSNAGFSLGDSCDVLFSNGYKMTDVPYYDGYYVKTADPVIVAYPHNTYVLVASNNNELWTLAELDDACTVEIKLRAKGEYLATQEALSQSYSLDPADYDSTEKFANFRALTGGNLKENFLYRGASPTDNSRNRASTVDSLLEKYGIECVVNLADSEEDLEEDFASEDFASEYVKTLYEEGRGVALSMGSNYRSEAYKSSVAQGMRHLIKIGGPAYIHCMEGKDRTGFVCLLLEALVGASYDEMKNDYMATYANYYGITEDAVPERYDAVVSLYLDGFLEYLYGTDDTETLKAADYRDAAEKYLVECCMTEEEIGSLKELISE